MILFSCGVSDKSYEYQLQGHTMGTQYHIRVPFGAENAIQNKILSQQQLQREIDALLLSINQEMSTYIENSTISLFNQSQTTNWFPVSKRFLDVIKTAQKISRSSEGAFDITVKPLVNLWGFGNNKKQRFPLKQQINSALDKTGYQFLQIQTKPPSIRKQKIELSIDLSAIAKGYAVDAIALLLQKHQFQHFLIEIGGEIRAQGQNKQYQPWRIAIEKPTTLYRSIQQGLKLSNSAIATSGDYRNFYEKEGKRYSHTIDPKTGRPITHQLASVTVLNKYSMIADAQATAIMVLGGKKGKIYAQRENLQVYMIFREKDKFSVWHNLPINNFLK